MTDHNMETKEQYLNKMHRLGRIGGFISILVMLGIPTVVAFVYGTFPGITNIAVAASGLLAIFVPVAISEVISYTPIIGSSIYLTLVTGNVTNLKIPVITNAMTLLDVKYGSEDADVISAISVSISSITTIIVIAIGVVMITPLQGILQTPAVTTASGYILPSLFGCMALSVFTPNIGGGLKAKGRMKAAIIPAIIAAILAFLFPDKISSLRGFLIILLLPVTYLITKHLYKKGQIEVTSVKKDK